MEEKTKGIYKRNEGRWEARFRVGVNADGRARYRSVYAQTREEVIAKRQAAEAEILAAKTRKRPTEFNLLIIGAGTHGRDVYEIARSLHVFRKILVPTSVDKKLNKVNSNLSPTPHCLL